MRAFWESRATTGEESVIRITRINDLIRVVTLHATIMASGSLTYLMGCGVNQYDHSTIDTRFKLQKVFSQFRSYRKGT